MLSFFNFSLVILSYFVRGVTIAFLWKWFVVPLGMPGITIASAIGLHILAIALIKYYNLPDREEDDEDLFNRLTFNILCTLIMWGIGALVNWLFI